MASSKQVREHLHYSKIVAGHLWQIGRNIDVEIDFFTSTWVLNISTTDDMMNVRMRMKNFVSADKLFALSCGKEELHNASLFYECRITIANP